MRVVIGCERSGRVRDAFTRAGHSAISCDLSPCDSPGEHFQGDVFELIARERFDLGIFHPPCTYLTVSAAWAFKDADFVRYPGVGYHQKVKPGTLTGAARRAARVEAVAFARRLYECGIRRVGLENPVGNLSTLWRKPDQTIQPWQFGEDASKGTCLWLKGLPPLKPTNVILKPAWVQCECCEGFICTIHGEHAHDCPCPDIDAWAARGIDPYESGGRYANQTPNGQNKLTPSDDRQQKRSETYLGVAEAMAAQWGAAGEPEPAPAGSLC